MKDFQLVNALLGSLAHSPSLTHFITQPVFSGSQSIVAGEGLCKVGQQWVNISNNGIPETTEFDQYFFNVLCSRHYRGDRQLWARCIYCFQKGHRATKHLSEVNSCLSPCQSRSIISVAVLHIPGQLPGSFQEISTLVHVVQTTDTCHHILLFQQILGFELRS